MTSLVLVLAFLIDAFVGEPPNRWHPVAWMGSAIAWARRKCSLGGSAGPFWFGAMVIVSGAMMVGLIAYGLQTALGLLPIYVSLPLQAIALKPSFSIQALSKAGHTVRDALIHGGLERARYELGYHLVSRDTRNLTEAQVCAAVVESIAENTSDSGIAPLFYYVLFGLPGAWIYRFTNTCDAMWGYRTVEYEWLGKFAARTDDVLNWIPARITAILMLVTALFRGEGFRRGVRIWWRDRFLTASPNAGQPMSAAAGILGIALEKKDHYILGRDLDPPTEKSIRQSIELLWLTSTLWIAILASSILISGAIGSPR